MPFQPMNYATIEPQGNPFFRDLVNNIKSGYEAGQMPAKMDRKTKEEQIANSFKQLLLEEQPEKFKQQMSSSALVEALNQARIKKLNREAELPFGGKVAPGSVGQAMWVNMIKDRFGSDSPQAKMAEEAYKSDLQKTQFLNEYRNALTNTTDKRAATPLVKLENEIKEVESGYMPGTGRAQKLEPDVQQEMLNRLQLQRQKNISDSDSRKRALFASNIDKTLDSINVKDLTRYAGLKGVLSKSLQEAGAPFGLESGDYRDFQKSLTAAKLLKKQVRQFYGDSITPEMQKTIEELTQTATWKNNPKLAKQNFNAVKSILKKETGTYRNALKSTSEFEDQGESNDSSNDVMTFNPQTGRLE